MKIQGKEFKDGILVIETDYSRSSHAGAGGCFQVVNIWIEGDSDASIIDEIQIDQGQLYFSLNDVLEDLGVNPDDTNYREEIV